MAGVREIVVDVRLEAVTAAAMKNAIFWDAVPFIGFKFARAMRERAVSIFGIEN
jgi:hypothetical protein